MSTEIELSGEPAIRVRPVELSDLELYLRLRGDADAMADLGGPVPAEGIRRSHLREVEDTASRVAWVSVIDVTTPQGWEPVGQITVVTNGEGHSEIGWMVLPAWQGRGIAHRALAHVLHDPERSRWGPLYAYPSVGNAASNRLSRAVGFSFRGTRTIEFNGSTFETNEWVHG